MHTKHIKVRYTVNLNKVLELRKAKYIKRWKGKDGKWKYEYSSIKKKRTKKTVVEKTFKVKVKTIESGIRNLEYEKCFAFDNQGQVLFQKSGSGSSIGFTQEEADKLKGIKLFTHNHPQGGSFSPEDIKFLYTNKIKGIRAIGQKYDYSAKITKEWNKSTYVNFLNKMLSANDRIHDKFSQEINANRLTIKQANFEHWNEVWKYLSKEFDNFYYKRERSE